VLVATYFFVGGLAGAAQLIATVVDLFGARADRGVVRSGRYLALLGSLISPVLLIADLQTPQRWFNMLRIYRGTSPMSIGSWALVLFGTFSGLTGVAQAAGDLLHMRSFERIARVAGIPAAVAGAVLATYTGTLLAATSVPLWSTGYRILPGWFGLSGTVTATAALSLVERSTWSNAATLRRLDRLRLLATLAEIALAARQRQIWIDKGVAEPLEQPPLGIFYHVGAIGFGIGLPLVVHVVQAVTRRDMPRLATVGAVSALVGGLCHRIAIVLAGRRSAERPRDYFALTSGSR
jgi:formate-dependent nitrite reductase membrane component NrfD